MKKDAEISLAKSGELQKSNFQNMMEAIAGSAIFAKIKGLVSDVFSLGREAKLTQQSFETMFGSAEKASRLMNQLSTFSMKNGLDPQIVREQAKQLSAMGIEAEKIVPTINRL